MNAKAFRTVALIIGLIFLNELTDRISDIKYSLLASLLFTILVFVVLVVSNVREGTRMGNPRLGMLKAVTYIAFVIFHAAFAGWVMYFFSDTVSAVAFALADTFFFLSSLYLLHLLFKKLYELQKEHLNNGTSTQPGGAPDAAAPRR